MGTPFKMKGHSLPGINQRPSPAKATPTPNADKRTNLLKHVPNEAAFNKLSDADKAGFTAAGAKAGLPQKKSPAKQKTWNDLSDEEVTNAIKRNLKKTPESMPELLIAQDSVYQGVNESKKRFENQNKPKKKKSPAKCPLLAMAPAIIGAVGAAKKLKDDK